MQCSPQRVIQLDPRLRLAAPFSPHNLLTGAMADLDGGAVFRSRVDIAERGRAFHMLLLPYRIKIVLLEIRSGRCYMSIMEDEIISVRLAQAIHDATRRMYPLVAWMVVETPTGFVARLLTGRTAPPYVLRGDTLGQLRALLPAELVRCDPQPDDPADLVELWFSQ